MVLSVKNSLKNFMQIHLNTQGITLGAEREAIITRKIEHLTVFADRLADESSYVKVDLIHTPARRPDEAYECHVTFFVPHDTLRAESHDETIEDAVDDVVEKLKTQIEHYKAKLHRDIKRKGCC